MKIMKTFVRALSVLAGALALTMVVGCDNEPPHECSFSESWTSDGENHWHACVCGEKSGVELHYWNDGEITKTPSETEDGIKTFECKICKAQKNIPIEYNHVHSYTVTKSDDVNHWKECKCGEKTEIEAHSFGNFISTDSAKHWKECSCGRKSEEAAHDYEWKYNDTKHWKECKDCGFKGSESDHDEAVLCTCGREKTIDEIPFKDILENEPCNPPEWLYGTWTSDGYADENAIALTKFDERRFRIGNRNIETGEEFLSSMETNEYYNYQEKCNSSEYVVNWFSHVSGGETYHYVIQCKKIDSTHFLFTTTNNTNGQVLQGPWTFTKE